VALKGLKGMQLQDRPRQVQLIGTRNNLDTAKSNHPVVGIRRILRSAARGGCHFENGVKTLTSEEDGNVRSGICYRIRLVARSRFSAHSDFLIARAMVVVVVSIVVVVIVAVARDDLLVVGGHRNCCSLSQVESDVLFVFRCSIVKHERNFEDRAELACRSGLGSVARSGIRRRFSRAVTSTS